VTFFSAHFPLAVRLSRVGLLALLGSVVLPISTQAQDAPKPQEKFYVSDKVAEELGKIRPIAEAKRWDEALAMVDALIKTSAPNSFDVVTLCNYKFQFLLNKGDNAAAIEPMETSLNLSRQFHYLEPSIELEITQYLAQIYLLESQAKGIKPEQQKQYYSKAAQYAEQVIQRTAAPTSDNYFLYAQVLYYWAMATPEKVDMELMKKAQVQVEKALLMSTRPKEQLWQMLNGILIQQTDYVRAGEIIELLVQRFPSNKTYWQQLQQVYLTLGANERDPQKSYEDNIRAIVTTERAQALGQLNSSKDNFNLVGVYINIGQYGRAADLLQAGLRNGTIDNEQKNWEYLAMCYQQLSKELKAVDVLKEATTHFPKSGALHFQIAQLYAQIDKTEPAYNEAVKALEIGNVEKPGAIYCALSYWGFDLGKYDEALAAVNNAFKYPEGPKDSQLPRVKRAIEDAIKERDFAKGTPPDDQTNQPAAGQKKQPDTKQSKSL
jgi:predicted Zn-dependent protease